MTMRYIAPLLFGLVTFCTDASAADVFGLKLPLEAVSSRSSLTTPIKKGERKVFAELEGPGCIRHLWMTDSREDRDDRNAILRIYFDGAEMPQVEAPLRDFFGIMHGKTWYPINTPFFSVQAKSGYNCYLPMPFAKSARVEVEALEKDHRAYCMVDWHQYPDQQFEEKRRLCARWRREFPTQRYGEDYLVLDADGPGQLVGFFYGLRLIDNEDRWSHGGADNIYLDGEGRHPSYLRGIGGEDAFGTSYGGSIHIPSTHLNASLPFYEQVDDGQARPSKLITGYRWFANDRIEFRESIHFRFGCMQNDICSTVFWYQEGRVRPFFKLPRGRQLDHSRAAPELPRGTFDLPLPDCGTWRVSPVLDNTDNRAIREAAAQPLAAASAPDKGGSVRRAFHGFLDFGHVWRPHERGVGVFHTGAADAEAVLSCDRPTDARLRIAWEGHLVLRVNDGQPFDLGMNRNFGSRELTVPLKAGVNRVSIRLSNERGFNHGGWTYAFQAATAAGQCLLPRAE
jgi:hypothetical protein